MNRTSIFNAIILAAVLLLSGALYAQNGASRQPLPAFKYRADNGTDTARQYKVTPNRENYGKCFVSDSIIIDDVLLSFLEKKYSLLNFEYDSILVTFHNFTRYFLCYQYVFIFTNGEAYLKTIHCNNYLMNIDTSTREILVKHVYDFFINKNKPIIINKKIRDKNEWYESDFPSIKIECYKKRETVPKSVSC